jgi:hypothetical protein
MVDQQSLLKGQPYTMKYIRCLNVPVLLIDEPSHHHFLVHFVLILEKVGRRFLAFPVVGL